MATSAAMAPALGCFAFAAIYQTFREANSDTSWLIDVCRRMLSGERPYVDAIGSDRSASILIYLAPTALARALGLDAGLVVRAFVLVGVAASLALCAAILRRAPAAFREGPALAASAAAATLVLPALSFDERDGVALYASLPFLAVMAARSAGADAAPLFSLLAGIGAGVAVSIEPTCALVFLAPLPYALKSAGWRAAMCDLAPWAAAATAIAYVLAVGRWFPVYAIDFPSALREVHLPWSKPLTALVGNWSTFVILATLALGLAADRIGRRPDVEAIAALASLGALAGMFAQGAGRPSAGYAGAALAVAALGPALAHLWRRGDRRTALALLACASILFETGFLWFDWNAPSPRLAGAIRAIGPRPTLMSVSADVAIGFPLATEAGARWVGRLNALLIADAALARLRADPGMAPADAARLRAFARNEAEITAQDILVRKPDAVLVGTDEWRDGRWLLSLPPVERALADYVPGPRDGRAILFLRRPRLRGAAR